MLRTIYGDDERYKETYWSKFKNVIARSTEGATKQSHITDNSTNANHNQQSKIASGSSSPRNDRISQVKYASLAQAAPSSSSGEPYVEAVAGGRVVARAPVDLSGSYEITHLLPGDYTLTAFNGKIFSEPQKVKVLEGQTAQVHLEWALIEPQSVFAFPNPAKDQATLRFVSHAPGIEAKFSIYDVAGNLIRELGPDTVEDSGTGVYRSGWDTRNNQGQRVASGVYIFVTEVREKATGKVEKIVKKVAIVR